MRSTAKTKKSAKARSAKECTYLAMFVALVIAAQLCLSMVPGVELVTVLFLSYAYVMGAKRGMLAATAFSLLRQIIFGVYVPVLILYLLYFNAFALTFGLLGKRRRTPVQALPYLVLVVCICTACFTMIDNILTPLWYGYSKRAFKMYFLASLPIMFPQIVCAAISTLFLFLPLQRVFAAAKRTLYT